MPPIHLSPALSRLLALGLILGAALATQACRKNPRIERKAKGEVAINSGSDPRTLDPGLITDISSNRAMCGLLRGLAVLDENGHAQPDLAESWTASPDNRVWEVKLRKSLWTNGEPVTTDDVLYGWLDRMLNPKFASEYAYFLYHIEGAKDFFEGKIDRSKVGVEALGPDRLRVRLVGPCPYFPQLLTHTALYPIYHGIDQKTPGWALRAETYVGDGPFKLVSYKPGDRLVAEKNPGYWNAANVAMNKLTMRFIDEESTERIAFDNGELDGTYAAPRPDIEELAKSGVLRNPATTGTYYLQFNMTLDLFKDLRVRRALALALDRASIVKNITRAGEKPALTFVPPSLYDTPAPPAIQDAAYDEARRLMAEAGYPGGKGFPTIHYLYDTKEIHRAIAQVLQESWKKNLGLDVQISNVEWKTLIDMRHAGKFEVTRGSWMADFADPINFLEMYLPDSGNNDPHWKDAKYEEMINRSRAEPDAAKRMAMLREAEAYFLSVLPIVPLYYYASPYLCAPDLEGYDVCPMNVFDPVKLKWKK